MEEYEYFTPVGTISVNDTAYPITSDEVKTISRYYISNPSDTSYDTVLSDIIAEVVRDWEKETGYLLRDQTCIACVEKIPYQICNPEYEIYLSHLNIRSIDSLQYYPTTWDNATARVDVDSNVYYWSGEIVTAPVALKFVRKYLPFTLYNIRNNLKTQYQAGYENNIFTDLPEEIKTCLLQWAARNMDAFTGQLATSIAYWEGRINATINKYKVYKRQSFFV